MSVEPAAQNPLQHADAPAVTPAAALKAQRRERRKQRLEIVSQAASLTLAAVERKKKHHDTPWRLSNTGPTGLWGYGMTMILVSLHYTGHWPLYAVAEGMAVVFGGGTQIIVGCLAYVRGNTFEYTMFLLSGCFWLTLVCIYALPNNTRPNWGPLLSPPTEYFLGTYFLLWTIVAFVLFCCTFFMNLATMLLHFTHFLWFLLLSIGYMAHSDNVIHAAGYVGVVSGGCSLYLGYAATLNEVFDRTILPVFPASQLLNFFAKRAPSE